MDGFDRQILKLLQQNAKQSTESIGLQIGLSATACQRRIKKLRQSGVIKSEIAVLNPDSAGGYVTVIVEISLKTGGNQALDNFRAIAKKEQAIQQLYYLAGDVDFIMIIVTESMLEYEKLTRRLFMDDENIQKYTSRVVINAEKIGLTVPI